MLAFKMYLNAVLISLQVVGAASILLVVIAILIYKWKENDLKRVNTDGFCSKKFEPVLKVFRENLKSGWEREGAAFAVYFRGIPVVDIWGGWADKQSERRWKEDTMSIAFSSSKAVAAVCVALLVDRRQLRYEQKISEFWPEFAKHGKRDITVEMIMTHTAGLANLDKQIQWEDAVDWKRMAKMFEEQYPIWIPGTAIGYHAITYGWLVDQIIRRVDSKKRGLGQYFKEEIAKKHGIDFHFGLPTEHTHRVARITKPSMWDRLVEFYHDPDSLDYAHIFKQFVTHGLFAQIGENPSWLQTVFRVTVNNPDLYRLEQGAALGIGTARALAKLFALVQDGKIVSKATLDSMCRVRVHDRDIVTAAHVSRACGVAVNELQRNGNFYTLIGHAGLGGQNLRMDRRNGVSIAYLSNGLKSGLGDHARTWVRLRETLYDCIEQINRDKAFDDECNNNSIGRSLSKNLKSAFNMFTSPFSPSSTVTDTSTHVPSPGWSPLPSPAPSPHSSKERADVKDHSKKVISKKAPVTTSTKALTPKNPTPRAVSNAATPKKAK